MTTRPSTINDVLVNHAQRLNALETSNINDSQPVDMFRSFYETTITTETFNVFTHMYHVCGTGTICNTTLIL